VSAVIEVRSHHSLATNVYNVWHFQIPQVTPVTEAQTCIDALLAFFTNLNTRLFAGLMTIDGLVKTVDKSPNNVFYNATTKTVTTTGSGVLPLSAAICCGFKSDFVGKSRRGRKYIGPITSGQINADGRTVATAALTAFTTECVTLMNLTTNGVAFGVWSRKLGQFTETNTVNINNVIASQRRRLT
jgi:hypothetical protein